MNKRSWFVQLVGIHGHEFTIINVWTCSSKCVVGARCGGIQPDPTPIVQLTCC
jgi:hypothetical protein